MKSLFSFIAVLLFSLAALAQQDTKLGGIVFDKDTKFRLNRVKVINTRTQQTIYNNTKGEFFIDAKAGDMLIASLVGYKSDTLKVSNQNSVVIYLQRLSIPLPEVVFKDSVLLARAKYEETKKAFNQTVRLGNNKDLINIGPSGAGLSIDAIWSAFSREGKNARRLMEIMERDYQNSFIDQIFTKELVTKTTGLKGDKLLIFMINFRPSYNFAIKANQYEMGSYINMAYMKFKMQNYQDISILKPIQTP
ncbi:MAG: carboxypeptidase-like regulatory domain-containing protein [Pelobium sp.]